MALSADDAARLASLKAAYDKLIAGGQVQRVRNASGREVEYGRGDVEALKREIDQLEGLAASTSGARRGALRFQVR